MFHLQKVQKKLQIQNFQFALWVVILPKEAVFLLVDKWAQGLEMALNNGVDLVIELPTIYNISSAENFADGAIKILNSLKIVDFVSFWK